MRISTRLRLAALIPALMALVMGGGLIASYETTARLQHQQQNAARVTADLNELNDLARSYVLSYEERPRRQYLVKDRDVEAALREAAGDGTAYAPRIRPIADDVAVSHSLFERLVVNHSRRHELSARVHAEAEGRLSGQLFIRLRSANSRATALAQQVGDDLIKAERRIYVLVAGFTFLAAGLLTMGLLLISRTIIRSLALLAAGTEAVGSGDLDHRIGLQTSDELGDLGRSFDRMSERLQGLTVSRDLLEREVDERRRAEAEVRSSLEEQARLGSQLEAERAQLRAVLENMAEAVGVWNMRGEQIEMNDATVRMHGFQSKDQMLKHLSEFSDVIIRDLDGNELPMEEWPASRVLRGERFADWELEVSIPSNRTRFVGSYSGAPIRDGAGEQVLGVVTVHDVSSIAEATAAAKRELARTTVLKEAATASATLDAHSLAERVLGTLQRLLGVKTGILYLLDEESRVLRNIGVCGYAADLRPLFSEVPLDEESVSGQALLRDEVLTFSFDELPAATRERAMAAGESRDVWMVVPIHAGGRPIGNLTLVFDNDRVIGRDDIALLRSLTDQIGVALENAELHAGTERELARTRLLEDVALAAATSSDMAAMSEAVLAALGRHVQLKGGDIRVAEGDRLRLVASKDYPSANVDLIRDVALADSALLGARAVRDGRILTHEDDEPSAERMRILERQGVLEDRYVYVPIPYRDEVLGVVSLTFSGRRPFSAEELSLYSSVAQVIGQAVVNGRLFAEQEERARLGEALARIDQNMHASLEEKEFARGALADGAAAIGAGSAVVAGFEEGLWAVWHDWGFEPPITGNVYTDEQNTHGVLAARTRQTIAVEDALNDDRVDVATMKAYRVRSVIVAPLVVRGEAVACLFYNYHGEPHSFTPPQVEFVSKVASSLSLAIENARLYEAERDIADRLQESLLALPAEIEGVEFAASYHSATESARVGGDFYDLFEVDPDTLGITMGDVAGKGLDAAVLTSLVKNTIRAHANERGNGPAATLTLTNDVVFKSTPVESFVTVFFGLLDRRTGDLTYCNAGHTTCAIAQAEGQAVPLASTGPLLGAFPDLTFEEEQRCCVGRDDALFLYTDGLTEARRNGDLYGEERVFDLLGGTGSLTAKALVSRVIDDVMDYTDDKLNDDLALLVVKRAAETPEPAEP